MSQQFTIVRAIVLRVVCALVGYAVLFPAYRSLVALANRTPITLHNLAGLTLSTLSLPFTDIYTNSIWLHRLYALQIPAGRGAIVHGLMIDLWASVVVDVALFVAIAVGLILFERRHRNPRTAAVFYLFAPVILWILWSLIYVLV